MQVATAAVDDGADLIAGPEAPRAGERFVHQDLIAASRFGIAAGAELNVVQHRAAWLRQRDQSAGQRLVLAGDIDGDVHDHAHVGLRDAVDLGQPRLHRERRAPDGGEHVGEAAARVVVRHRALERVERAEIGDEHRDARREHERDGERLPAHHHEVPDELPREGAHGLPVKVLGARAPGVAVFPGHPAIGQRQHAVGHVRDARVVRDHHRRRAQLAWRRGRSRRARRRPSRGRARPWARRRAAPIGRLAMARAMATRCCSPPESWEGKWPARGAEPDERPAPRRACSGCSTISVTSATFSRAVRLGIRL